MNLLRAESRQIEAAADGSERSQCDMLDLYRRWRAFAEMRTQSQVRLQAIALTHACRAAARTGDIQLRCHIDGFPAASIFCWIAAQLRGR